MNLLLHDEELFVKLLQRLPLGGRGMLLLQQWLFADLIVQWWEGMSGLL